MDTLAIVAVLCAYVVKGATGFANTLTFTTIMSFGANTVDIAPVELLVGYPSNIIMAIRERRALQTRIWAPLAALIVAASIPGALLLKNLNADLLKVLFGLVVVGLALEMALRMLRPKAPRARPPGAPPAGAQPATHPAVQAAIGLLAGLMCGMFGVGALMAAYMSRTAKSGAAFRSNLCMVFAVEGTFRIALYAATGILTAQALLGALALLPFMLVGLTAGMLLGRRLNERLMRAVVIALLLFSGLSLTVRSLLPLLAG